MPLWLHRCSVVKFRKGPHRALGVNQRGCEPFEDCQRWFFSPFDALMLPPLSGLGRRRGHQPYQAEDSSASFQAPLHRQWAFLKQESDDAEKTSLASSSDKRRRALGAT